MVSVGTKEPQGGEVDGKIQRDGPGLLVREYSFAQRTQASEAEAEASPSEYLGRPDTNRPFGTTLLPSGVVYYCWSWDG